MLTVRTLASGSGGNCYLVSNTEDGSRLLLDCGAPFKKIQAFVGYDVAGLAGVLVSHSHKDHALAVGELLRRGVKVYGTPEVAAAHPGAVALRPMVPPMAGNRIVPPFAVTPFAVEHDVPCNGYVIDAGDERLAYITDAHDISVTLPCVTVLMIEANHDPELLWQRVRDGGMPFPVAKRVAASHMPIMAAVRLASEIAAKSPNLREVWLIHLSAANAAEGGFRERVQAVTSAVVRVAGE